MHRRIFSHYIFGDERFSKREAWVWLLCAASHHPNKMVHKNEIISVKRGQVPTSYRKLAEKWGWSANTVSACLRLWKNDGMIDTNTDTGFLIITICKYDEYQIELKSTDTHIDTNTDTSGDTFTDTLTDTSTDTNIIKGNEYNEVKKEITTLLYRADEEKKSEEKPHDWTVVGGKVNQIVQEYGFMPVCISSFVPLWLSWEGVEPEMDIYPVVASICAREREKGGNITTLSYISPAVGKALAIRKTPMPKDSIPITGNKRLERMETKTDEPPEFNTVMYFSLKERKKRGEVLNEKERRYMVGWEEQQLALLPDKPQENSVCDCGGHYGIEGSSPHKRAQIYAWQRRTGVGFVSENQRWLEGYESVHGPVVDQFEEKKNEGS